MPQRFYYYIIAALCLLFFCTYYLFPNINRNYVPKPKGYVKVVFPPPKYLDLKEKMPYFPYNFAYAAHAEVNQKIEHEKKEDYWLNIYYPIYDAVIQLTYKQVKGLSQLQDYIQDSHQLIAKHYVKASGVVPKKIYTIYGNEAFTAEIQGEVATAIQFYITDGKKHFLRGVLYFNNESNNNYLAPIIQYIKQDILYLIHTTQWNIA